MDANQQAPTTDEKIDQKTTDAIAEHTTCCLCGTDLTFKHQIDFSTLKVVEDAHCPACRIQLRQKEHILN